MIIQREQFLRHSPALLSLALSLLRLLPSPQSKPSLEDTLFRTNLILTFGRFADVVHGEGFTSPSSPSTANSKFFPSTESGFPDPYYRTRNMRPPSCSCFSCSLLPHPSYFEQNFPSTLQAPSETQSGYRSSPRAAQRRREGNTRLVRGE